jgi:hypothetical protein
MLLGAGLLGLALSTPNARAGTILVFGQNGIANTLTASNNGASGAAGGTTLSVAGASVTITAINAAISTPFAAFLNLSASSVADAVLDASGHIAQAYDGSF